MGFRILPFQGERQFHAGISAPQRILVLFSYRQKVSLKGLHNGARQNGDPVFPALPFRTIICE